MHPCVITYAPVRMRLPWAELSPPAYDMHMHMHTKRHSTSLQPSQTPSCNISSMSLSRPSFRNLCMHMQVPLMHKQVLACHKRGEVRERRTSTEGLREILPRRGDSAESLKSLEVISGDARGDPGTLTPRMTQVQPLHRSVCNRGAEDFAWDRICTRMYVTVHLKMRRAHSVVQEHSNVCMGCSQRLDCHAFGLRVQDDIVSLQRHQAYE